MLRPLIYNFVKQFFEWRYRQFIAGTARARELQHQVLLEKIQRNADSDFGRAHGFSKIRTVVDFRRQVPIADYEYFREYIDRVKLGQTEALFGPGTKVHMFALTSGTTNKSKYIPVTQEFFREYRRGWFVWGTRAYLDHNDQFGKLTVQLSSNWQQFHTDAGIPCGNISGLAADLAPQVVRLAYALPLPLIKIQKPDAKHYTALRISMARPHVGMMITANPSTLLEFARRANTEAESLIRDIHDGTLSKHVEVSRAIRERLRPLIARKKPRRARVLARIIERTGTLYPKDFWPQLSFIAVWMGGSVGVYLPLLKDFYGDTALRDHGLSASEGRMTIPIEDGTSAGILDYAGHFFEFIPEDQIGQAEPTVLEGHELEVGKHYYILLTTSAGLYRYDIHDVVRCVDFRGQAPVLQFLHKGAHFSSITGEKLSEFQAVTALQQTFAELDLPVEHFTIAPVMRHDRPGYVVLVEPNPQRPPDDAFARCIERHLVQQNMEYADKLESGRLLPLSVQEIPAGTWTEFRRRKTAERGNLEEYKHPCLVGDLQFVEKIVAPSVEAA